MNPVDFRIILRQIGVDLRLMRRIENDAAGGYLFPHTVFQKMSADASKVEQLVIGETVWAED